MVGDAGATHSKLRDGMLRVHHARAVDGVLLAGDNFYPCGVASVSDPQWSKITEHFGPLGVPIWALYSSCQASMP